MLRFLLRALALLALAAGFAAIIIDGTRSIAGAELSLTPVSDLIKPRLPGLAQMAHPHGRAGAILHGARAALLDIETVDGALPLLHGHVFTDPALEIGRAHV